MKSDDDDVHCFLWCFRALQPPHHPPHTANTPPSLQKCNSFPFRSSHTNVSLSALIFSLAKWRTTRQLQRNTSNREGGVKGRLGQRRGWDREGGVSLTVWHLLGVSTPVAPSSLPPSSSRPTPPPPSALEKRQGSLKLLKSPLFTPPFGITSFTLAASFSLLFVLPFCGLHSLSEDMGMKKRIKRLGFGGCNTRWAVRSDQLLAAHRCAAARLPAGRSWETGCLWECRMNILMRAPTPVSLRTPQRHQPPPPPPTAAVSLVTLTTTWTWHENNLGESPRREPC